MYIIIDVDIVNKLISLCNKAAKMERGYAMDADLADDDPGTEFGEQLVEGVRKAEEAKKLVKVGAVRTI